MSKAKKNYSKVKQHWRKRFPQISRFIPAKRAIKTFFYQGFLTFLILGVIFFLLLNLVSAWTQPQYLKDLLKNPYDLQALKTVLLQNQTPELDSYLKNYLQRVSNLNVVKQAEKTKQAKARKIASLEKLLQDYPQYPDGYAYLALLYYQQRLCEPSLSKINQALVLDPNRQIFQELKQVIVKCSF